jgi:hypothetical protein
MIVAYPAKVGFVEIETNSLATGFLSASHLG